MSTFDVKIKSTGTGEKIFTVSTGDKATIAELKQAIEAKASVPAGEQRVIYKGQVLKDERTIESYGKSRESPCSKAWPRFPSFLATTKLVDR